MIEDNNKVLMNEEVATEGGSSDDVESKKKAKEAWGVRLDAETISEIEQLQTKLGLDKRGVLEYLLRVKATAELKGIVKGKTDTIENVEKALDLIRDEMNTLLRHNVQKEEEVRIVVQSEINGLEDKIRSLQAKLNDQLTDNKTLKEDIKTLKAEITDKKKEIEQLTEDHASTKKLNLQYEEKLEDYTSIKEELKEIETVNKELQSAISSLKDVVSSKDKAIADLQTELNFANNELEKKDLALTAKDTEITTIKDSHAKELVSKDKEIASINAAHEKEIAASEKTHAIEVKEAESRVKSEFQDKVMEQMNAATDLRNKLFEAEKEKEELIKSYDAQIAQLKEELLANKNK